MLPSHYKGISLNPIIDILTLAGNAIMNIYNSLDLGIEQKSDESLVTKADLASNQILVDFLSAEYPSIHILSEEIDSVDYDQRSSWQRCWIIDPLDGTREFITHGSDFCINLALVEEEEAVLGFVYLPVQKICYIGVKGVGSFKIQHSSVSNINVSTFEATQSNLRIPVSKSYLDTETTSYINHHFNSPILQPCGAGLKFAHIAEGLSDIYPRCQRIMEWDVAAGHAIIKAAGGKIVEMETGQELKYNQPLLKLPYFVAMGDMGEI